MAEFNDGMAETRPPQAATVTTDVLIVGSGPAGASAALFLSTLGVDNIMVTKYRWTANTPRAHITNQRSMEIFRDMGIEDQVLADATEHALVGDTVFCTAIAGEEIGRIHTWGTRPDREGDYQLASPCLTVDIPQTYLEPILVRNATMRGTQARFSTEYLAHRQDADGVDVDVLDRLSGHRYTIRAKYVIGADGARSKIAADIGLPFAGDMDIAGSMNITFKADIARYVDHRPSVLYWVLQPGSNVGGIGAGLVRMVRPWDEWLVVWGYDINDEPPAVDEAAATQIVRNLLGVPDLDVEITGASLWGNNEMYATHLQRGRVFCAGDAIHRHPPSNGLGSNTSVQDSYNLAWKIAAVLNGQAAPALLDTYSAERAPVAERIVKRANKSSREFVRAVRGAGRARSDHRGGDGGRDRGTEGQHPTRRRQARRSGVGDGSEELRIQRPRCGTRPVDDTRPAVEAGERLGFLPGTLSEKIDPYLRPLYDALHDMMDPELIPKLMSAGVIEVAPLAYMRGRTLSDSFIILDEAQNTTAEQMKMFLTRLGFGSKMVVTGDVTQIDLPGAPTPVCVPPCRSSTGSTISTSPNSPAPTWCGIGWSPRSSTPTRDPRSPG